MLPWLALANSTNKKGWKTGEGRSSHRHRWNITFYVMALFLQQYILLGGCDDLYHPSSMVSSHSWRSSTLRKDNVSDLLAGVMANGTSSVFVFFYVPLDAMHFGLTSSAACFTLLRATFAFWRWVPSSVPACTEIDAHGCIVRCSTLNTRRCDGSRSFLRCCYSLSMVNYLIGLAGVIGFTYLLRCYRLCNRSSFSFRSMMTLISVSICWVRNMIRHSTFHCKWTNIVFLSVNFIFLIDSLAYFVGYILFLRELEDVFNGSSYQRPAQVAVIR